MQTENARSRAWVEIDLDAIAHNVREMKKMLSEPTKLMAVVKANAYGHGVIPVTKAALAAGADVLGVATAEEALTLRAHGIDAPILILGITSVKYAQAFVENNITVTVDSYEQAKALSEVALKLGKKLNIHLAVDTGMSRIGFDVSDSAVCEMLDIAKLPGVFIEGIFTHFAKADETDKSSTHEQFAKFSWICEELLSQGVEIPVKHVSNSAATIDCPEYHLDMVRVGIAIYGCYPSEEVNCANAELIPAMSFRSRIVRIDTKPAGTQVSYGGIYQTDTETIVATVSVGYADGYMRNLSNHVEMLVGDIRVPQIGRICMDQCMIDVTDVHTIAVGDEVILFGRSDTQTIKAADLAKCMGTIDYELLCAIGERVPRIYLKDGNVIDEDI